MLKFALEDQSDPNNRDNVIDRYVKAKLVFKLDESVLS